MNSQSEQMGSRVLSVNQILQLTLCLFPDEMQIERNLPETVFSTTDFPRKVFVYKLDHSYLCQDLVNK